MEPGFARDYLKWKSGRQPSEKTSDAELMRECCEALQLDLVCVPSESPEADDANRSKQLTDVGWFANQGLFVFWLVNGVFQLAMERIDFMTLMKDLAQDPVKVAKELQRLSYRVVETISQGLNAGAHGIIIGDDIAYRQGTLMSPDFVQRHLMPIWKDQVAAAREFDVQVFFHSDGNLNNVLPVIAAAGFDGLQCIEPSAGMDIAEIKRTYGKDLCLMGNIDPSLLSMVDSSGDVEKRKKDLRDAVLDLLACADGHGGLIVGTSSGLYSGMSPELVDFMYQVLSD